MFSFAYGRAPNYADLGRAIAAFERTLVFLDAPFDRFLAGDTEAISEEAARGWVLFNGKGRCMSCHQLNPSIPSVPTTDSTTSGCRRVSRISRR